MRTGCLVISGALLAVGVAACVPALPDNVKADGAPQRSIVLELQDAVLSREEGLDDALWLEVTRASGTGTVGGYLSRNDHSQQGIIILLHGASTFSPTGSVGATRMFHETFGAAYRDAGFRTLSLDYQECGTAYGQGDVDDLVEMIDWLERTGKAALGLQHTYAIGYSAGGTTVMVAARRRAIDAAGSIAGLSEPRQLEDLWNFYRFLGSIYPSNEGFCQLATTLATYGPPGAPGWGAIDTVGRIGELQTPLIVFHGTQDQIFYPINAENLQRAWDTAVSEGISLPELQVVYLDGQDHFQPEVDPELTRLTLAFFERHAQ